ncbi:hypothetical protein SH601_06165 [Gracilibacillus sp. S3-1-1]|uniref:Uncharacterized protein n=1 Tax=Gracilibacillus pellucidus TaxID=3095368 RepID=A0ACC6M3M6_9BACI|nr:hypothetical protein [Gracilibacillus sp. S3-1-1]MDX8045568.1 hypothetical protein [Gracilibacillus sp. S3-1-1]
MYSGSSFLKRIVSLFAIPILGVLAIGLCLCTVIAIVGGLLYTFGADINMEFGPNLSVPSYLGLPTGILFGAFLLVIAYFSWRLLKYLVTSWNV